MAAGSSDRHAYVWDTTSRHILYKLPGHNGSVNSVEFHPKEPIGGTDCITYILIGFLQIARNKTSIKVSNWQSQVDNFGICMAKKLKKNMLSFTIDNVDGRSMCYNGGCQTILKVVFSKLSVRVCMVTLLFSLPLVHVKKVIPCVVTHFLQSFHCYQCWPFCFLRICDKAR